MMATCRLYGHKYNPQIKYAQNNMKPGLFPTKITTLDDCWVSVTKKGTYTKEILYEFVKWIIHDVRDRFIEGKMCGSQIVTSLGSSSGLFHDSRRITWSCFSCLHTAPPLTRPSESCLRDGTILTAMRSSNTSSICETRVFSSTIKTLHYCLEEHEKTGDPWNQLLTDGVLLGSPLQDWIHMSLLILHFWPPWPRIRQPLCPLRLQWNCHFPLQWEAQGKAAGRPP